MDCCISRKGSVVATQILVRWPKPTLWDDCIYAFRSLPFDHSNTVEASSWLDGQEEPQPITEQSLFDKIELVIEADNELCVLISKGALGSLYRWMGTQGLLPIQEEI